MLFLVTTKGGLQFAIQNCYKIDAASSGARLCKPMVEALVIQDKIEISIMPLYRVNIIDLI